MKYYDQPYQMTKADYESLGNKISEVRNKLKRKNVQIVMISPYGVKQNKYSINLIHQTITLDDLLNGYYI